MDIEKMASTMTDEEIDAVIGIFYEEQQRRRGAKRQKLIDNFHNAFTELRNAGITPKYYENPSWNSSTIYVDDWDSFEFD